MDAFVKMQKCSIMPKMTCNQYHELHVILERSIAIKKKNNNNVQIHTYNKTKELWKRDLHPCVMPLRFSCWHLAQNPSKDQSNLSNPSSRPSRF